MRKIRWIGLGLLILVVIAIVYGRLALPPVPDRTPATPGWKYRVASEIPEETRQRIYYDLISAEDKLSRDNRFNADTQRSSEEAVAKSYGLDYDTISKIWGEGLAKGWPVPKL